MNDEQKFQLKLNESIKDYIGTGMTLYMPAIISITIFTWHSVFIRCKLVVVLIMLFSVSVQFFMLRKPFVEVFRIKKLKARIASGKSKVAVETIKMKSFDLINDVVEYEKNNFINVEYTTDDEYYYLTGENNVTLVTVEGKTYAFATNRF